MVIARTGQGRTQAPQPVQRSAETAAMAPPPSFGLNVIALDGQLSSQARHTTPFGSTQWAPIIALSAHAGWVAGTKQSASQAAAHAPHSVHDASAKSTIG